jgi:preprotein translocase subunit YajC
VEALPLLILVALMWLLLIRPQQQRVRRQRELVATLEVGDRVVTIGGIKGTVVGLDDEDARIEVAPGTVLTLVRPAVSRKVDTVESRGDEGDEG